MMLKCSGGTLTSCGSVVTLLLPAGGHQRQPGARQEGRQAAARLCVRGGGVGTQAGFNRQVDGAACQRISPTAMMWVLVVSHSRCVRPLFTPYQQSPHLCVPAASGATRLQGCAHTGMCAACALTAAARQVCQQEPAAGRQALLLQGLQGQGPTRPATRTAAAAAACGGCSSSSRRRRGTGPSQSGEAQGSSGWHEPAAARGQQGQWCQWWRGWQQQAGGQQWRRVGAGA